MSARRTPAILPASEREWRPVAALPPTHLPSVHDLGVAFGAAIKESLASTEVGPAKPKDITRAQRTERTFTPRADALRDLITTLPAATLADVVVQLGILVTNVANQVEDGSDGSDPENERMQWLGRVIDRIALSCLMVVAREARVDLEALDLAEVPGLHVSRFAGLGGAS